MRAKPMADLEPGRSGWQISDWRGYEYAVFAPRPNTADAGIWQAQWRNAESDDGGTILDADVEEVLVIFPIRVAAEFRRVIDEYLFAIMNASEPHVKESVS